MIGTEQQVIIGAGIDAVWAYVRDIRRWAGLMPGLQGCDIVDDNDSRWTLKVGAGALVRTVKVNVHVDKWDGPGHVDFSYDLASDPVRGGGYYTATSIAPGETEITLSVRVEGTGPMAPMWEAMGKPLLPKFARGFADQLKAEIELAAAGEAPQAAPEQGGFFAAILRWLKKWFGSKPRVGAA